MCLLVHKNKNNYNQNISTRKVHHCQKGFLRGRFPYWQPQACISERAIENPWASPILKEWWYGGFELCEDGLFTFY